MDLGFLEGRGSEKCLEQSCCTYRVFVFESRPQRYFDCSGGQEPLLRTVPLLEGHGQALLNNTLTKRRPSAKKARGAASRLGA